MPVGSISYDASRCIRITALCGSRFSLVLVVRAHRGRHLGRLAVAAAGHERGDRAGDVAALVRVVREAVGHQERAEVRVAQAELAERAGVLADLLGRVARRRDDDLLREEHDVDGVLEALDVEAAVVRAGTASG